MPTTGRRPLNQISTLEYSRGYRSAGINILSIKADGSKRPAPECLIDGKWKYLQSHPVTDDDLIRFLGNSNGIAAIGGAISGNLEVIDFDQADLYSKWAELVSEHLGTAPLQRLVLVRTPRPGIHVVYRCPAVEGNQKLAEAPNPKFGEPDQPKTICLIETKGEGGYFLLPGCPPACHPTGRTYELLQGDFDHIPEITVELREVMLTCARTFDRVPRQKYENPCQKRERRDDKLLPGEDFDARGPAVSEIIGAHGYKFFKQHGETSYWTRPGKSSGISCSIGHGKNGDFYNFSSTGPFPKTMRYYSKFALKAFLEYNGDFKAAARALRSAGYGTPPKTRNKNRNSTREIPEPHGPRGEDTAAETERPTNYSDDALANQFSTKYCDDFKYVDSWGWLRWTGQRWKRVPDVVVMDHARRVCRVNAQRCLAGKGISLSDNAREGLARTLASARVVSAVVKLAKGDPRHYSEVSEWDSHHWLFNTPGGTINLKTGEMGVHQRENRITKIASSSPRGDCPQWIEFLSRVTGGNTALQEYLQRLAGYAMCGAPSEECLDFFYGEGGNGKGTFLKTVQHIFGEYSTTAATETFMESRGEKHPTDVAKLAGARLVVAQEVNEGQHWNESRLKTMTGRDELTARFMRRDLFDFTPEFTLIISGNNKPALKSVDEAWRRRFHVVPFEVCIPKDEQNPNLKTELLRESDGILNWCLTGCLEWQRQRLNPPEAVLTATADYLSNEDTLEIWLQECCIVGHDGYEEASSNLYSSYRRWKESRGEKAPGTKTFSQRLNKHSFHLGRDAAGRTRVFRGVRLTDDERKDVKAVQENQKRREQGNSFGGTDDE